LRANAGAQQANHQVLPHASAVQSVVEFGDVVPEMFLLELRSLVSPIISLPSIAAMVISAFRHRPLGHDGWM